MMLTAVQTVALLRPDATVEQARSELGGFRHAAIVQVLLHLQVLPVGPGPLSRRGTATAAVGGHLAPGLHHRLLVAPLRVRRQRGVRRELHLRDRARGIERDEQLPLAHGDAAHFGERPDIVFLYPAITRHDEDIAPVGREFWPAMHGKGRGKTVQNLQPVAVLYSHLPDRPCKA